MAKHIDVDKHQAAFRLYAKVRNKSRVSQELGIPVATIHVWAKQEGWDTKLNDLRSKLEGQIQVLRDAKDNAVVQDQISSLNLLEHLETTIAEVLLENQIRPTRWSDVIQTLSFIQKEKRLITGQPTEIPDGTIEITAKNVEDVEKDINTFLRLTGRGNGKDKPAAVTSVEPIPKENERASKPITPSITQADEMKPDEQEN